MANLTAALSYDARPILPAQNRFRIKDGTQLYEGSYVEVEAASGDLVPYTAAGRTILGRVQPTPKDRDDATYLKGDATSPRPEAIVFVGSEILIGVAVTGVTGQVDVDKPVYLSDDNVMTLSQPGSEKPLGRVTRFVSSTTVDVQTYSHAERAGL